jgi:3-(methylthio)propionyl---CoA ligase
VLEVAVTAMPSEKWGERPIAFVTLCEGGAVGERELIAFARESLPGFKAPDAVRFGPLPKTSTGKVKKYELRERARAGATEGSDPPVAPDNAATTASGRGSPGTSRPDRPPT